jgi:hypothetical protein
VGHDVGQIIKTISASRGGAKALQRFGVAVIDLQATNSPPSIQPAGPLGAVERSTFAFQVIASDPDGGDEATLVAWCERRLREALRVTVDAEGDAAAEPTRWQRAREEDARVRKHVMREVLNRHVAEVGEVPDGASVAAAEDRLYVK